MRCSAKRASAERCAADPGLLETGAIPGLQRTTPCCAAPGTRVQSRSYMTERMLESLSLAFAEISLPQLAVIAGMALVASVVGGVAGYGTGALMPLVLVPMVGAEPVVPILSISALLTNASRAFRSFVDGRRALIVLVAAVPTCVLGAWGYTLHTGKGAAMVIGAMLVASVP